jgi:transcriptional regulator with XRE-family HTH domain
MEYEQSLTTAEWEKRLGADIRRLRIEKGLTQAHLAERANVSLSTIRYLEAGRGSSLATLIHVAKVLDRTQWLASLAPVEPSVSPLALLREFDRQPRTAHPRFRPTTDTR